MALRRVVITGTGAVSPYGVGVDRLMEALYAGRSAVVNQRSQWQERLRDLTCWVGAPVSEPLDHRLIPRKFRRSMGRVAILACLAAFEARKHARIPDESFGSGRMGVSFASTVGSIDSLERFFSSLGRGKIEGLPATIFFQFMSHTCAANLAQVLGITGRVLSPSAACGSSLQAIGCGFEAIQSGAQDIMLCGGAEELHVLVSASFDLIRACSSHFNDQPTRTPRPFDRDRDGTVCGEGAGALILESEECARARGVEILAEVAGYATNSDGMHMSEPHRESITACLREALVRSALSPESLDYVNAHATGTLAGDQAEAEALRAVFGEGRVAISSFKGHFGHTLGASGALETIACLVMQKDGYLIPSLNLETPGEGCLGLDHVTTLRRKNVERFAKNSFAFGGINSVLILTRYHDDGHGGR